MTIEDKLKKLIESKSGSIRSFAVDNDMPYTTVRSILERGVLNAKMDNIIKICKGLEINPEQLLPDFDFNKNNNIEKIDNIIDYPTNTYNYFDAGVSAGVLQAVDPFTTNEVKKITLSQNIMGKYAGDKDIFLTRVNGESMNRVIPNNSLIAIKEVDSIKSLKNGDIIMFQDGSEMSIKRFYNNEKNEIISFLPDSSEKCFEPMMYKYEDIDELKIVGKVVVYTVEVD